MNRNDLMGWIQHWESRRTQAYTDTMGHPTVGVGFNLDAQGAIAAIAALGLDYNQVRSGAQHLTDAQIDTLFTNSVNLAVQSARGVIHNFDVVPGDQQIVIVDMIFNLGVGGFSKFVQVIKAINIQDWNTAAQQMQNSAWYHQVGARAKADCDLMAGRIAPSQFIP
jgi:GH24 family phage-related lysozyme (muramidase)